MGNLPGCRTKLVEKPFLYTGFIKFHLKRVVGNKTLTFEELYTVLTQIEACLNSRPICALSENVEELEILTPAHFLIGNSLLASVGSDIIKTNENRLTRWGLCKKMRQEFWIKWSNEYIHQLQKTR